ncbi:MAG TPA: DUF2848 family protein [Actinomycetes bacterium]|jgi:hypothetical protein|nr:DUF2848 family protein [Actinomycetes bacterium]
MISVTDVASGRRIDVRPRDVVLAGYTGRDQDAVRRHVEELAAHGVPAPRRVPAFYRVTPDRVIVADRIDVLGPETSGEGEFVLLAAGGEVYVGVGSDHTDRGLERDSVWRSKQLCPKVVGPQVWRLADAVPHWDHLVLRSYTGAESRPYQEGPATTLLDPAGILERVRERTAREGEPDGLVVFSGTLPLLGRLEFGEAFAVELVDEEHGPALRLAYAVDVAGRLD